MLRKMLGWRPIAQETKSEYMARVSRRLKRLRQLHRITSWDLRYLKAVFAWAGHVARIAQYDADRLTLRTMHFKNWNWIQSVHYFTKSARKWNLGIARDW